MELVEAQISRKFRASITFHDAPVAAKHWAKWKGRKGAVGWSARRTYWDYKNHAATGYIKFTCTRPECYGNMTPEIIRDIQAMISLLKGLK
jgi:hypothetical protein